MKKALLLSIFVLLYLSNSAQGVPHVILITIDGMRPEFYQDSTWPCPNMQHMRSEGTYAKVLIPVFPTLTQPNHTTMITGALPARHGVYYNVPFNPTNNEMSWHFFANVIKVPTLFDVLHAQGEITAAADWPVTVGAPIDYNFPDYWGFSDSSDNIPLIRASVHPPDLWNELQREVLGVVPSEEINSDHFLRTDENAGRIAAYLLRKYKPTFMAFHITETDHAQHSHGRDGYVVRASVAAADRAIGSVLEAIERAGLRDSCTILIAGDHGFSNIDHVLFPNVWLAENDFLKAGEHWGAKFQSASGSGFLYLEDNRDTQTISRITQLLHNMAEEYQTLFGVLDRKA